MILLTRPDGTTYCPMRGHADRDCPGYGTEEHLALIREGLGTSTVPGPTDAELRAEIEADHELLADEFHGRLP